MRRFWIWCRSIRVPSRTETPDDQPEEFFATLRDYDKEFLTAYGKKTWRDFLNKPPENPVYYPAWNIPLPDGSEEQMANKQLTDTSMQYLPKAILAEPKDFESVWSEYVSKPTRTRLTLVSRKESRIGGNKEHI